MKIFTKKNRLSVLPVNFEIIKTEADKIQDLYQRELFYTEFLIRDKQEKCKGDITQQITYEIEFLQRTIELSNFKKTTPEPAEKDGGGVASIKVRAVIMLESLKEMGIKMAHHDRTKICKLIAYVLGCSYHTIYKILQEGINFNDYHSNEIDEANQILKNLSSSISIDIDKQY